MLDKRILNQARQLKKASTLKRKRETEYSGGIGFDVEKLKNNIGKKHKLSRVKTIFKDDQ